MLGGRIAMQLLEKGKLTKYVEPNQLSRLIRLVEYIEPIRVK